MFMTEVHILHFLVDKYRDWYEVHHVSYKQSIQTYVPGVPSLNKKDIYFRDGRHKLGTLTCSPDQDNQMSHTLS